MENDSAQGIREGTVFRTLLDYGATMAELRIDDLRREAARERLARGATRRTRRHRRAARRVASRGGLHPATAR